MIFDNVHKKFMRVFVSGTLGLVGRALVDYLKERRISCVTADIRSPIGQSDHINICEKEKLQAVISNCDGVIHLAAVSRIAWGEQAPKVCDMINIMGTKNILDACINAPKKPWLVFASSREVYGQQETFPIKEECTFNPRNVYAKSKLAAEKLVEEASNNGLRAFIARFSNVYGGMNDHRDRVVPAFCINAINNDPLRIDGADCIYDFTHINDVVEGIFKIISFITFERYSYIPKVHFTTGKPTSLLELAEKIIACTGSNAQLDIKEARPYSTHKFYGDNTKAKELLNWSPQVPIDVGIKKFITDLKTTNKSQAIYNNKFVFENENFKSYSWLPSSI